jgi:hypothetical protein
MSLLSSAMVSGAAGGCSDSAAGGMVGVMWLLPLEWAHGAEG